MKKKTIRSACAPQCGKLLRVVIALASLSGAEALRVSILFLLHETNWPCSDPCNLIIVLKFSPIKVSGLHPCSVARGAGDRSLSIAVDASGTLRLAIPQIYRYCTCAVAEAAFDGSRPCAGKAGLPVFPLFRGSCGTVVEDQGSHSYGRPEDRSADSDQYIGIHSTHGQPLSTFAASDGCPAFGLHFPLASDRRGSAEVQLRWLSQGHTLCHRHGIGCTGSCSSSDGSYRRRVLRSGVWFLTTRRSHWECGCG